MKKALIVLTCALGANCALFASGAFAQQAAAPAANASAAAVSTGRDAQVEQRIAKLHSELKITSAEEAQWDTFAGVMRDNATTMRDMYQQRAQAAPTDSALDNMKQYSDLTQAHADGMKKLVTAFEPLYDSLSPAQKQLADAAFRDHQGAHRGHMSKEAKPVQQ
jgi:hypothetical protein